MKIKRFYILAGGSATRWKGYQGVKNKCYLKIDGETLVDRTIRLLEANGINNYEVILDGYDSKRKAFEGIAKKDKGGFGILLGDCYYTEAIIKDATSRDVKEWTHYYNCLPNPWTGCNWEEGYIHLVPDRKWWADKMAEFNNKCDSGEIKFEKDYQIDRFLRGYDTGEYRYNELDKHDIFWCDETDDFDYPEDYDKFMDHHGKKERGDYLSIIIPNYNNLSHLKLLLENLVQQRLNGDYAEIIVVDDGSDEPVKQYLDGMSMFVKRIYQPNRGVSNARNTGIMASTGKYISFVDSDDQVANSYIRVITREMRQGYDYLVFCWRDVKNDNISFNFMKLLPGAAVWCYAFTYDCIGDERFDENMLVGEDYEWLKRVIREDRPLKRGQCGEILYDYDWNANPDSLCKKYNRGDIPLKRGGKNGRDKK